MNLPRLLGIDYGLRRVGIALTDAEGKTAYGYTTLDVRKCDLLQEIARILDEEMVHEIVMGLPLRTDNGTLSETAKIIQKFATDLKRRFPGIPLHLEDEGFTSFAAEEGLRADGWVPSQQSKAAVDKAAARILLQDYLDERNRGEHLDPETAANRATNVGSPATET